MQTIWAKCALTPKGWVANLTVSINESGKIAAVRQAPPCADATRVQLLLPAPLNAHSHTFQRAMAGLTEGRGPSGSDSFWTWRQLMFRFLERLSPGDIEAISAQVQMEMLEAGFAAVAEFHYLHHRPDGQPYDHMAETSQSVIAAADHTGIGLTLLPVHYEFGGCDQAALGPGQRRFGNDMDRFIQLHDAAGKALRHGSADMVLGAAPHSLRAVGRDDLRQYTELFVTGPLHMHLAEQRAEVAEVEQYWSARPVSWALDNMNLGPRWCLIHCTQMTPQETAGLARTDAVAGLCPITEGNLGDGVFDGVHWAENDGRLAIGSDSNIRISLTEEIRLLEYTQRLRDGSRAAMASTQKTAGRWLFDAIVQGGAQAGGRGSGQIDEGCWADLVALDTSSDLLWGREGDHLLDGWIFAGDDRLVTDVWSAGRHIVRDGAHIRRHDISANFKRTLDGLRDAI